MPHWVLLAILSAVFAGFTSVIAKRGLEGISGELGLVVRTVFVCIFVGLFALVSLPRDSLPLLTRHNTWWLGLSGVTTAASWICYYRALKLGDVATIALIDKGSFLVAVLMAWWLLGETPTARILVGSLLILSGLLVVSWKPAG
jgi:transporter family protein